MRHELVERAHEPGELLQLRLPLLADPADLVTLLVEDGGGDVHLDDLLRLLHDPALPPRAARLLPHEGPIDGEQRTGGKSGALRAAIFGANDGLVSNLSLIMGVAGAGVDHSVVILAGVAGVRAGAFSMAAGEDISMRGQGGGI